MGTIMGAAGGVIRDVLCAEVPLILRREIYATASIAGGAVYVLMKRPARTTPRPPPRRHRVRGAPGRHPVRSPSAAVQPERRTRLTSTTRVFLERENDRTADKVRPFGPRRLAGLIRAHAFQQIRAVHPYLLRSFDKGEKRRDASRQSPYPSWPPAKAIPAGSFDERREDPVVLDQLLEAHPVQAGRGGHDHVGHARHG